MDQDGNHPLPRRFLNSAFAKATSLDMFCPRRGSVSLFLVLLLFSFLNIKKVLFFFCKSFCFSSFERGRERGVAECSQCRGTVGLKLGMVMKARSCMWVTGPQGLVSSSACRGMQEAGLEAEEPG